MRSSTLVGATTTALITGAAGLLVTAAGASAAAPSNDCPRGYQLLSVATLTGEGYQVPALVDGPTVSSFGQPGNGDGWVCAVQLGNRLTPFGLPVYNFTDNQLPA